jgi:hypothetical protein
MRYLAIIGLVGASAASCILANSPTNADPGLFGNVPVIGPMLDSGSRKARERSSSEGFWNQLNETLHPSDKPVGVPMYQNEGPANSRNQNERRLYHRIDPPPLVYPAPR